MARKGTKIKRYGSIYGRESGVKTVLMLLLTVTVLAVFAVIGWLAYTPVHDFLMQSQNPASRVESSSPALTEPGAEGENAASQPQQAPIETLPAVADTLKGVYLPQLRVQDEQVLEQSIKSAAQSGINTVVFDAKDATGAVLFESDVALARGAITPTPFDVKAVAAKISENGLIPAARLFAFRDSMAPIAERDAAVFYYDTEIYWFDNAPEAGGKPWLNPYSPIAQQYIIDLAKELCESGCKLIIVEAVQFPSGYSLNMAGYGGFERTMTRTEALSQFVEKLSEAVSQSGGQLITACPNSWLPAETEEQNALINAANQSLYGGAPTAFLTKNAIIELPSDLTGWASVLNRAKANDTFKWTAAVPAVLADGTARNASELIAELEKLGEDGFLLYNPQGEYIF